MPETLDLARGRGPEVNAWLIIGSDDTVTIRVAQSEMGKGVFTSMPMLVAEELECDWTKVRAEYASANRSLRENRVYQRMATGGSGAVRRSREYLQQAGASARARLIAAAAQQWGVPASECRAENGTVMHAASGRKINYGAVAAAAARSNLTLSQRSRRPTSSVAGPVPEPPRCPPEGQRHCHLRHRRALAGHALCLGDDLPGVRWHTQTLRFRRHQEHARRPSGGRNAQWHRRGGR